MIKYVIWVVVALFPISELALAFAKRSGSRSTQSEDRGSRHLLMISVAFGFGLAIAADQWVPSARLPGLADVIRLLALGLMLGSLALRWAAVLTLGRLFTLEVHRQHNQNVIEMIPPERWLQY